jgi:hypothetical protein
VKSGLPPPERESVGRAAPKRSVIPLPGRTSSTGQTPSRPSSHSAVSCLELLELLRLFQRLVAEAHFWPDYRLDGPEKINKFNRHGDLARFDELYSLASAYVNQLQALSVRDTERVGRNLNKPNVHRLIELYAHTILGGLGMWDMCRSSDLRQPTSRLHAGFVDQT